jgi:hypothetical protein
MLTAAEAAGDIVNTSRILDLQNTLSNVKLAQTAVSGFAALQSENIAGVINASLSAYGQTGGKLPSGLTTAMQTANLALAIKDDNFSAALVSLGDITNSKDLYVAAAAKNLIDAFQNGNETNIAKAGIAFGNAFQASNNAATKTKDTKVSDASDVISNLQTAGLEEDNVPDGLKLANLINGTTSDAGSNLKDWIKVSGSAIFAGDDRASKVKPPAGYELAPFDDSITYYDDKDRPLTKPDGTYYDITQNAWFKPTGEFDLSSLTGGANFQSDLDLFNSSVGDLDQIAALTNSTSDDYMADFLKSIGITSTDELKDSNLSNQDILDFIGLPNSNVDELIITGDRPAKTVSTNNQSVKTTSNDDNIDELVITDKKEDTVVTDDTDDDKKDDTKVTDDKKDDTKVTCPEGYTLGADGKTCVPITKQPPPPPPIKPPPSPVVKKPVVPQYYEQPGSKTTMSSQDPYAKIKLMQELFGTDIAYKLLGIDEKAGKSLGAGDLNALLKLLGSK